MNAMCQTCGSELTNSAVGPYCEICHRPFCKECEKSDNPSLDEQNPSWCCKSCLESRETLRLDGDDPADMNPQLRENGSEDLDTGKNHQALGVADHQEKHRYDNLFNSIAVQYNGAKDSSNEARSPVSREEICLSKSSPLENHQEKYHESGELQNSGSFRSITAGDDSDGPENGIDRTGAFIANIETDPLLWIPPEPEDMEDEMESVANNEDDDDYSDGTKWGQPSSLSSLDEEQVETHCYKEERQKAMMEAMNGQFKLLVSRFLASEGIFVSDGEDAESWLSIVASLSWEAALLVKPDASEGRAMDPGSYVKVKCIATGARHQSQVIKGLVFKKNTAHKHMSTKFKNPRLLLLRGSLGHSAAGLSSFNSMEEERDYLKSIVELIETSQPNVVLVEKSVSRDIQESLLAKGITLVFDMKLPRLERIAQCTGSQIVSSADFLVRLKLKHCDLFHIEKFLEEHNGVGEGGKKPMKTLMFLEGCPKPLGCTILLQGAQSDELKKVKRVMHYTVFAAYHLILETSFFADQRAFFTDTNAMRKGDGIDKQFSAVSFGAVPTSVIHNHEDLNADSAQPHSLVVPISDGSRGNSIHGMIRHNSNVNAEGLLSHAACGHDTNLSGDNSLHSWQFYDKPNSGEITLINLPVQPLPPGQLFSSVSASLKRFIGESLPPPTSGSIPSYISFREQARAYDSNDIPISFSLDALDHEREINGKIDQEKPDGGTCEREKAGVVSDALENIEQFSDEANNKDQMQNMDGIERVLDPQSILVLFSSQCITKQTVCEQSHLSRIKYYGNFDVSLGRILQDILLNQKHSCSSCGEPPESHVYCYTHQNGKLTVLVRRLPQESTLPGEAEGKIWMWTRCLKCEHESGIPKSTRRVVMSSAARGLSFGKFLELNFSNRCASGRLSRCGHSLHRDSLRFFGLGSKVAMFRYSSVDIYAVCMPPPVLEFYSPNGQEWLKTEAKNVLEKGDLFFTKVANELQNIKLILDGSLGRSMKILTLAKEFSEVEEMLMQEKTEFEASLMKAINHFKQSGNNEHGILGLNWLKQELLLEQYVWDRRLRSIFMCIKDAEPSADATIDEGSHNKTGDVSCKKHAEENVIENGGTMPEAHIWNSIDPEEPSLSGRCQGHCAPLETGLQTSSAEISVDASGRNLESFDITITDMGCLTDGNSARTNKEDLKSALHQHDYSKLPDLSSLSSNNGAEEVSIPILDHVPEDQTVSVTDVKLEYSEGGTDLELKPNGIVRGDEIGEQEHLDVNASQSSPSYKSDDPEGWVWGPFSELRNAYRKALHGGFSHEFRFVNCYSPTYLLPMDHGMDLLFPVGPCCDIISGSEDDISSIIACALALSEDRYGLMNNMVEKELDGKGEPEKVNDISYSLLPDGFVASSYWSSTGSSESEGLRSSRSTTSFSSDELSTSVSDGSLFIDRLLASEDLHPEVSVGSLKTPGKSKCSVVVIHAKQFYALRRRCCPSEMAYISSLSRCKKWDAQGGKSKAFFAKTLDDRFIIKQIKKTELESFLEFASDYFKHISLSLDSGSQTCLAKILGIYQVRQNRNGKEVKTDLMVMENLLFGRNVSRTYDLKGAVFARYVSDGNNPEKVLLDENFIEDMRISPIYIGGKTKNLLQRAIWNDTSFLTSINVMDYSLLVGVDKQRRELVFGIIDYVRQYTWDKQLETWVKASLVVPKNSLPTVISPKEYKKRFRKFMTKYFLTVPDSWSSDQHSDPCKLCVNGSSSSHIRNATLLEQSVKTCG